MRLIPVGSPPGPGYLIERKVRGVIDDFHDHVDVGSVQPHSFPGRGTQVGAYFPVQFNGGLDKPFVRALGRDAKGFKCCRSERGFNGLAERREIRRFVVDRQGMGQGIIRHPERMTDAILHVCP